MLRKTLTLSLALLLAAAGAAVAQPPNGPAADPSAAFEVVGTVVAFTAAYGSGMPTLSVDDASLGVVELALGPVWYLQQEGFAAAPGDEVTALAFPCATCSAEAVAVWVENHTAGLTLTLRDDEGRPLWIATGARGQGGGHPLCRTDDMGKRMNGAGGPDGNGGGQGTGPGEPGSGNGSGNSYGPGEPGTGSGPGANNGPGEPGNGNGPGEPGAGNGPGPHGGQCAWGGPDMSAVATVTGTVVSVSAYPGDGWPVMVLATAGGELEMLINPYHPIAAAGFLIEEGMELIVTYAPWAVNEEMLLVAISLTDPVTGIVIQLRDPETGYPLHGGYGPGGF